MFDFVKSVNGYSDDGEAGVGTTADIVAGSSDTPVSYHIEVTEFVKNSRIVFRRYGGPLSGRGKIEVRSTGSSTIVQRTSFYEDDLSDDTIRSLSAGIDKDNPKLKRAAESGEPGDE